MFTNLVLFNIAAMFAIRTVITAVATMTVAVLTTVAVLCILLDSLVVCLGWRVGALVAVDACRAVDKTVRLI